jgi:hypothetical protein
MAVAHQVLCITKSDRNNPYERITHIGGKNADGSSWRITQEKAIGGIEEGHWKFYVKTSDSIANVIVSTSTNGNKYLKTTNDGEAPNNLLSLPECS